jgi:hypothetical protein
MLVEEELHSKQPAGLHNTVREAVHNNLVVEEHSRLVQLVELHMLQQQEELHGFVVEHRIQQFQKEEGYWQMKEDTQARGIAFVQRLKMYSSTLVKQIPLVSAKSKMVFEHVKWRLTAVQFEFFNRVEWSLLKKQSH